MQTRCKQKLAMCKDKKETGTRNKSKKERKTNKSASFSFWAAW